MVPIRNLYYLFLYAWDRFAEGSRADVGADDSPDLPNLLARVLASGVRRQVSRGLNRNYIERVDELALPRGKFLLQDTVKRSSLASGRAVCQFDELNTDTLPNRILRAAIQHLCLSPDISVSVAVELRRLEMYLQGVALMPLSPTLFRSLQVTTGQQHYGFLMDVCRLVMDLSLPDKSGTGHRFYDILNEETRMSDVFERFVRNFYRLEQNHYSVAAETIRWPAICASQSEMGYLPTMVTDVTLRSEEIIIVIDAKFYKQTFIPSRFGDQQKVRSSHLYQLQSYLEHSCYGAPRAFREGILLYPSISGGEISLEYQLPRSRIRVCTLDLTRPWQHLHRRLIDLVHLPQSEAS